MNPNLDVAWELSTPGMRRRRRSGERKCAAGPQDAVTAASASFVEAKASLLPLSRRGVSAHRGPSLPVETGAGFQAQRLLHGGFAALDADVKADKADDCRP